MMAGIPRVVLVVDDEPDILAVLKEALGHEGYSLITALGPIEAIQQSRRLDGEIHLLLTDVVMPEMDGVELARQLTAERPGLRVLLISGYSGVRSKLPLLAKPFNIVELLNTVSKTIDGPPALDWDKPTDEKSSSRSAGLKS